MKKTAIAIGCAITGCAIALSQPALANDNKNDQPGLNSTSDPGKPMLTEPAVMGDKKQISAQIVDIDPSKRLVRLKSDAGRMATVLVGSEIENFDNLQRGDTVNATYTQALAVAIKKGAETDLRKKVESGAVSQRRADGKPAINSMTQETVVANVFEIRPEKDQITLRGTNGEAVEYQVKDQSLLEGLDEGDQVVMSYVQASAVAIEPQ